MTPLDFIRSEPDVLWYRQQLEQAERLIWARRSMVVTGRTGIGKTTFISILSNRIKKDFEIQWLNLTSTADPFTNVDLVLEQFKQYPPRRDMVVILDGAEAFQPVELHRVIRQFTNYKLVHGVIATSQHIGFDLSDIHEIELNYPVGKLYDLQEQVISPEKNIVQSIAPTVVIFNEALIEQLKRSPTGLFTITPRQFEEVIADLLSGMGLEVELTPATRDGGKDILAYMQTPVGKLLTLVEAKQHNKNRPVGVSLVRSLFGTVIDHQASSGMLVTTSRFAKPAQQFQEKHKYQLELKEYSDVVSWLLKHKS